MLRDIKRLGQGRRAKRGSIQPSPPAANTDTHSPINQTPPGEHSLKTGLDPTRLCFGLYDSTPLSREQLLLETREKHVCIHAEQT